ncbi:hypothetical protein BO85DRAFT_503581, partial [Aspergillus piperis CBS 112811]
GVENRASRPLSRTQATRREDVRSVCSPLPYTKLNPPNARDARPYDWSVFIRRVTGETSDRTPTKARGHQVLSLDDLDCNKFNDGCIDESLFMPWIMDTHMQQSSPSRSKSSSGGIQTPAADLAVTRPPFSARRRSATEAAQDRLPGIPTADSSFASLLGPSDSSSTGDAECCSSREDRLDLLLADLRNSIETLAVFISCDRCATRVEQNMLLAMAARPIGVICGRIANCCKAMLQDSLSDTGSSQQGSEPVPCPIPDNVSVATYRVNRREKLHLLGSLAALQIMDFQRQINIIKSRYRNRPNKRQVGALSEADKYVKLAQVSLSGDS